MPNHAKPESSDPGGVDRREFVAKALTVSMAGGLVAGYGAFGAICGRYLYPAHAKAKAWMFVSDVASFAPGRSIDYRTPAGAGVVITRQRAAGGADDFLALSSTCPHLGCQVKWEGLNNRFFCPCHNGVFDPTGRATGGPPGEAQQSLPQYPLKIDKGLLFIEVPVDDAAGGASGGRRV